MASRLYAQSFEVEIFVDTFVYFPGLRHREAEKRYIEDLEESVNDALFDQIAKIDHLPYGEVDTVEVHKIVYPLTYEIPKERKPYAFVKCSKIICDLLLKAGEHGIMFSDSKLRLAISKGIPSDQPNNIRDEIITDSKKNKSVSLHPLAIASSYLEDINSELRIMNNTPKESPLFPQSIKSIIQKEFDNKIVIAQGK